MRIDITDSFRIMIDTYGNHQPEIFDEGGEEITIGKMKGQISKPKWAPSGKYFNTAERAVRWGIENGHLGVESSVAGSDVNAGDFLSLLQKHEAVMESFCKKVPPTNTTKTAEEE